MAKSYYPDGDADQLQFVKNLIDKIAAAPGDFGLTAADVTELQTAFAAAEAAYGTSVTQQIAARSARQAKDDEMDALEALIRQKVRVVQAHPAVTDAQRADLQINVPDTVKTPAATPESVPGVRVDTAAPLQHRITFFSEDASGTRRGKPAGVRGAEIYRKIGGDATMNESEYQFLALDTDSPYVATFDAADGGKQSHYLVRWISNSGEPGPWNLVSATITTLANTDQ